LWFRLLIDNGGLGGYSSYMDVKEWIGEMRKERSCETKKAIYAERAREKRKEKARLKEEARLAKLADLQARLNARYEKKMRGITFIDNGPVDTPEEKERRRQQTIADYAAWSEEIRQRNAKFVSPS